MRTRVEAPMRPGAVTVVGARGSGMEGVLIWDYDLGLPSRSLLFFALDLKAVRGRGRAACEGSGVFVPVAPKQIAQIAYK